jgi:ribonuclease HI
MGARRDPGWDSLWDAVGASGTKEKPAEGRRTASPVGTVDTGAGGPARDSAAAVAAGSGSAPVGGRSSASRAAGGSSAGGPALKTFIVRTDGAARGNPGPASSGAVLIDGSLPGAERPDAPPIATISEYLGIQTNNVAEYTAVVRALALAEELGAQAVDMLLDSKLIVEQLHGRWRVKDAKLIPLHGDAKTRLGRFDRWSARHVPRAQNKQADALCNEAIDRVQAGTGPRVVVRRPS